MSQKIRKKRHGHDCSNHGLKKIKDPFHVAWCHCKALLLQYLKIITVLNNNNFSQRNWEEKVHMNQKAHWTPHCENKPHKGPLL